MENSMEKKVTTDQKLELVRIIRAQNEYNRRICKSREQQLYAEIPGDHSSEIYGLEAEPQSISQGHDAPKKLLGGFRIRFVMAIALFLAFVFWDQQQSSFLGYTKDKLQKIITQSIDMDGLMSQINTNGDENEETGTAR